VLRHGTSLAWLTLAINTVEGSANSIEWSRSGHADVTAIRVALFESDRLGRYSRTINGVMGVGIGGSMHASSREEETTMRRLGAIVAMGAFLASNALPFSASAITDTSVNGTAFATYNTGTTGLLHFGDGLYNNSGSMKGVTGTISLRTFAWGELIDASVFVYGGAATSCWAYRVSSNGAAQTGYSMTPTAIGGGTRFDKLNITIDPFVDTLSVYCELGNGARLAMLRARAE
jgi:hypothetical protein